MSEKKAEASFENPLIPHAKLRQIYLAMVQARMLEKALPASRRGRGIGVGAVSLGIVGLEACLVSPAISLEAGDLISDAVSGGVVEFLRGAALGEVFKRGKTKGRSLGMTAGCGAAAALAGAPAIAERLWAGVGAGLALKAANESAKKLRPEGEEAVEPKQNLEVVYLRPGEAAIPVWRSVLKFAAEQVLPMLFIVLPPVTGGKASGMCGLAQKCGVPGIPVDGADAVALYRVAQESVVRARMGGGAALIECVPYVVEGSKAKASDGIAGLEQYMLERRVVTREWVEREAKGFAKRIAGAKAAGQ